MSAPAPGHEEVHASFELARQLESLVVQALTPLQLPPERPKTEAAKTAKTAAEEARAFVKSCPPVKQRAAIAAAEAAEMILRVDDIIKAPPRARPPPGMDHC